MSKQRDSDENFTIVSSCQFSHTQSLAMLRPRLRAPRLAFGLGLRATANARRSLHHVPELPHDYSQGVPNLMSAGGFSIAWTDYMKLMIEKLNALTVGMLDL